MQNQSTTTDSTDFYKRIEALAMNGYTDAEIANEFDLAADVFGAMKNGKYWGWNEEDNKRRGEQICGVLAHGRTRINALVRSAYLKGAFGVVICLKTTIFVISTTTCQGNAPERHQL